VNQAGPRDGSAADARSPRIDAHHHLWDIESGAYDWPTPADGAIYRTFTVDDLATLVADGRIDGTVLVQTVNTLAETDAMLELATIVPWIRGVVGWVPLDDPAEASRQLDARAGGALRGIRHLIHHEPDPDWVLRRPVFESLREVGRRGLAFDVVAVFPEHLRHVPVLADAVPDATFVIDHLANPPYRRSGWDAWRRQLAAAAGRPNVAAKLSGLTTAAGAGWTAPELWPAIDVALEAFGADRIMFGSDWPVCLLESTYAEYLAAIEGLLTALTVDERASIMGGAAARVYRL
jgi:L-fuconolactonase